MGKELDKLFKQQLPLQWENGDFQFLVKVPERVSSPPWSWCVQLGNKRRYSHSRILSKGHQQGWTWQYKVADCLYPIYSVPLPAPGETKEGGSLVSWQPAWCSLCQDGHSVEELNIKGKFCQTVQIANGLESKQCLPLLGYSTAKLTDTGSIVTFQEELSSLALAQKLPGSSALPGREGRARTESALLS